VPALANYSILQACPTAQLRFAVPARIARPHGVPPWCSGEEGVAGAIDRLNANHRLTDLPTQSGQILQ